MTSSRHDSVSAAQLFSMRNDSARGARLTAAMLASGRLFNCQLCYDIGVTESTLSRWRSGGPMSTIMAIQLAKHLAISLDWLILGFVAPPTPSREPDVDLAASMFAALPPADQQLVLALNAALTARSRIGADASRAEPGRIDADG